MFAVANVLPCLAFVAGHHPHIASPFYCGFAHAVVTIRVAKTNLPALLTNPQMRFVANPTDLIGEEIKLRPANPAPPGQSGSGRRTSPVPGGFFQTWCGSF